jgi:YesN/AraC family two-component response regulator
MVLSTLNQLAAASDFAQYFFVTFSLLLFGTSVFISRVLFRALRKPEIFSLVEEKPLRNEMVKLGIDEEESKKIAQHLLEHMERQRPFLDPELTLDQLAGQLSIRPKILSYVINHSLKQNFFDFVNRHRVEEAKRLLRSSSDSKMTVLEVLYKVGFNSKSSFNTLFRKYTGVTPTDFKQSA